MSVDVECAFAQRAHCEAAETDNPYLSPPAGSQTELFGESFCIFCSCDKNQNLQSGEITKTLLSDT